MQMWVWGAYLWLDLTKLNINKQDFILWQFYNHSVPCMLKELRKQNLLTGYTMYTYIIILYFITV